MTLIDQQIKKNELKIKKLQLPKFDPNSYTGQKYVVYDKYNNNYAVKIIHNGAVFAYKRFNDIMQAIMFRDRAINTLIDALVEQNKVLSQTEELKEKQLKQIKSVKRLLTALNGDLKAPNNMSGEKYVTHDEHSLYGEWCAKIKLGDETLLDKRFYHKRDAISERNRQIPVIIEQLKTRLNKLSGLTEPNKIIKKFA